MNTPQVITKKRTFEALKFPKGSPERATFNDEAETSEYYTSHKWVVLVEFLMSDGTPHPRQKYIASTFKTRTEAQEYAESRKA